MEIACPSTPSRTLRPLGLLLAPHLARPEPPPSSLAASLIGYLVLYAGDITEGVFAALGWPQVAILSAVVAIAACLLVWARRLHRTGALR
jgi:hypothetical protein